MIGAVEHKVYLIWMLEGSYSRSLEVARFSYRIVSNCIGHPNHPKSTMLLVLDSGNDEQDVFLAFLHLLYKRHVFNFLKPYGHAFFDL